MSVRPSTTMSITQPKPISPSDSTGSPTTTTPITSASLPQDNSSELPRPVVLPPRAKPGRKPATDTPVSKRKAQNREAQRNFRERKKLKEEESLEDARRRDQDNLLVIKQMQEQHAKEMKQMRDRLSGSQQSEIEKMKTQLNEQNSALQLQQQRNEELSSQLQELLRRQNMNSSSGMASPSSPSEAMPNVVPLPPRPRKKPRQNAWQTNSNGRPTLPHPNSFRKAGLDAIVTASSPPTPPAEDRSEDGMEIDFTHLGKSTQEPPVLEGTDEWCGFCQNNTYCACRDKVMNPPIRTESFTKPTTLEPSAAPVGPGGCRACLDDPERRRICLSMAKRRQDEAPPYTPPYSVQGAAQPPSREGHMSCTDAITYGRQNDPEFHKNWNNEDFIRKLRVISPKDDSEYHSNKSNESAAQEVEIASIMAAMSGSGRNGDDRNQRR